MKLDLNKLKLAQARSCLSVNELVNRTGLGRATISKTLNGKAKATPKTVGLIAKALSIDVTEIISGEE
ncbi:helix-turn-helix domain-containing protein [Eubacterium multiforme]|uniref:Transcriptional regulator with XRE-family HTH domain n=1 Tax=Eubacterium multiforme TaxID=83339 RepID=A0ABT9UWK8_9FIRM|nr:helix-turn-helix transcriptional regulator [Eubacterium multiforme]MDQ0150671.1 transcriptional regulator with XRE-family HTH domain [Eubacterium multiforme]